MDAQRQQAVGDRISALLDRDTTQLADSEYRQPVADYIDRAHLARERDALFRRQPLLVAASAELEKAGDFRTMDIDGISALVVRQADGSLRAFHNVCRHRGTRVVDDAAGCRPTFTCKFHSWVYGADGRLRHVPGAEGFTGIDRADHALTPLPVAERHGLVWLGPITGDPVDIDAFLGPAAEALADLEIAKGGVYKFERFAQPLNWKLVVDTFLELYHLKHLHAKTVGRYVDGRGCLVESLAPHGQLLLPRDTWQQARHLPTEQRDLDAHLIRVIRLFPNAIVIWNRDHVEFWTALPDGDDPDRCVVRLWLISPERTVSEADRARWDKNWELTYGTVRAEDFPMAATIQAGFHSGAQDHVVFGRNEPGLHDFHESLRLALAR
ncbi:MAG: aromatic ring-hydroxylating dioxygenase subunit alpha [Rhodospirillales bacterium]|nr:MAG: aromatic ring-hydroxylating dioxygenase subunit alpha [Rhodospirillales bacterium]